MIGRLGTAAIAARLIARQTGSGLARDVSAALATLAAFQLTSKDGAWADRIDGDGDVEFESA